METMFRANLVCTHDQEVTGFMEAETYLFEEDQSWVVHDGLAIRV